MDGLPLLIMLTFFSSILGLIGGVFFLVSSRLSSALSRFSIPFAAGVLLTTVLVGLLPEAVDAIGERAFLYTLLAFIGSYMFEQYAFGLHHHDEEGHHSHVKTAVPLVIVGDTIHNFVDGVALAAAFMLSPGLGVITAISTFLHEVPHEIGDFGILLKAGWKKNTIIMVNLLSAASSFLGVFAVVYLTQSPSIVGTLISIAAGMFLYLGASDFLPQVKVDSEEQHSTPAAIALLIGVVVMLFVVSLIPHGH